MPDKLPKPKTCPCCGGELEHTTRTIQAIGHGKVWKKFKRPVHICRGCNIAVVIHRVPRQLANCGLSVAGGAK